MALKNSVSLNHPGFKTKNLQHFPPFHAFSPPTPRSSPNPGVQLGLQQLHLHLRLIPLQGDLRHVVPELRQAPVQVLHGAAAGLERNGGVLGIPWDGKVVNCWENDGK